MITIYCVKIVRAFPDYMRPYANASVYHFLSIKEANEKRREEKRKYFYRFIGWLDNYETIDIDDIDDEASDLCYSDSYMDQEPFEATLYEIVIDHKITTKEIPFPHDNKLDN